MSKGFRDIRATVAPLPFEVRLLPILREIWILVDSTSLKYVKKVIIRCKFSQIHVINNHVYIYIERESTILLNVLDS